MRGAAGSLRNRTLYLLIVLMLLASACSGAEEAGQDVSGDSENGQTDQAAQADDSPEPSASAVAVAELDPEFCDAAVETLLFIDAGPQSEADNAGEVFVADADEQLQELATTAPDEVAELIVRYAGAAQASLPKGEEGLGDPEYVATRQALDDRIVAGCGYTTVEVGVDEQDQNPPEGASSYAWTGIEETAPAGKTAFRFTNNGQELHHMIVAEITSDATLDELLDMPESEAEENIEDVGFTYPGTGDGTGTVFADLKPGSRYGFVCFFSQGAYKEDGLEQMSEGEDGSEAPQKPPHALLGMKAELQAQ